MGEQESETPGVDMEALRGWLDQHIPSLGDGALRTRVVSGGSTNLILSIDRGGPKAIFRAPPPEGSPEGAKTIHREARIVLALTGTAVPSPAFLGYEPEPDVVGLPFYVMEEVDGWAATITADNVTHYPAGFDSGPDHHYISWAMTDGLIELANLDYVAAGLGDLGRPDGFLERQPDRWLGQVASYSKRYPKYEQRDLPGLRYTADWLRDNVPSGARPGLMHADFAPNNALFAHRPPTRLAAIIDWETTTIGDPLLDLAAFANHLVDEDEADGDTVRFFAPGSQARRDDVIAYYGERTGRDMSTLDYYAVLSKWRAACMIEYKVAESVQGLSPVEKGARFNKLVRRMLAEAEQLARAQS